MVNITKISKKISNIAKQKIDLNIELDNLPDDVSISTMTITCKIATEFLVANIGKYIDLKYNGIVTIMHGDSGDKTTNRSLIIKKQSPQKQKKKKKAFYNQVTIVVKTKDNKMTNIKLFSNGSIQMTGCRSIEGVIEVLSKVFTELKTVKATLDYKASKSMMTIANTPNSTAKTFTKPMPILSGLNIAIN